MADEDAIVARCAATVRQMRSLDGEHIAASVGSALADLELLPPGHPVRVGLAEQLVRSMGARQGFSGALAAQHLDRLVELADEQPSAEPGWRQTRAVARVMALLRAEAQRKPVDRQAALEELERLAVEFAEDRWIREMITGAQALLGMVTETVVGDVDTLRAVLENLRGLAPDSREMGVTADLGGEYLDAANEVGAGDDAAAFAALSTVGTKIDALPPGHPLREAMAGIAPIVEALSAQVVAGSDPDPAVRDQVMKALQTFADRTDATPGERAFALIGRGGAAMQMGAETDLTRINAGIDDLRKALSLIPEDHPDHVFGLASLAMGMAHRSQNTGLLDDVDETIGLLERARTLAKAPSHQHWSFVNGMLGEMRRRRGDARPSRLATLEGLRGHAWRVLLQPDPASARAIARGAAEEAMAAASRCLSDHAPADALRTLDAGRALMLFAATELRDPCTRLVDAGWTELADRWRAAPRPSVRLREEVLEVLSRDTGLLDPPDLDEIQEALRRLDADALVYLVPADFPAPGWAVIAPVEGPPRYIALPHLLIEEGADIERCLAVLATRGARLVGPAVNREFGTADVSELVDSVDLLCGWAWKAAMGPLVKPYLGPPPTGGRARVPRLVLVPMGDLARIPWQAARDPDGGYVVEQVAISQTASARMLCDAAAAEPVPLTPAGLILADPDTGGRAADLVSARLEAYGIHRAFYPGATYVGRRPDGSVSRSGAGTADDVRAWLRADGAQAGAMLHLASHGIIETARDTTSSRLVLAGGDLTADELIGVMGETTRHPVGLVVLAACHTGQSIHGYDEAYSLGTMFLAAGARSVLSTQWSIPDQDTSLLMYMFHHFLMTECRPPWDALRLAQVWMLDADRRPPQHMPAPLRRALESTDPARVVAWAGFVHWGQ